MSPAAAAKKGRAPEHAARPERTGGRSARVLKSVLEAALEQLTKVGYTALRIEDVAGAAGVNKTTVYRRWPTKMELVRDALLVHRERTHAVPNTGSLRDDLRGLLHAMVDRASTPLAYAWLAEMGNADVRAIMQGHRRHFEDEWSAVIARGMARGELPPETSPLFLLEVLVAPVAGRLSRGEEVPTRGFCDRVVDLVLAGARALARPRREGKGEGKTRATRSRG